MRIINNISRAINYVALGVLVIMMLLTVSDVALRFFINKTIPGSTELTEFMMVCVVFFAFAWCAANNKHIKVDLLVSHCSPRVQAIIDSITYIMALFIFVVITWNTCLEAMVTRELHIVSTLLKIPSYPFYLALALGTALLCAVVAAQLVQNIGKSVRK